MWVLNDGLWQYYFKKESQETTVKIHEQLALKKSDISMLLKEFEVSTSHSV